MTIPQVAGIAFAIIVAVSVAGLRPRHPDVGPTGNEAPNTQTSDR
ncbi:MAG: hypothetical protein AB8G14_13235 [Ilumatobacter sp.]